MSLPKKLLAILFLIRKEKAKNNTINIVDASINDFLESKD